VPHRKQGVSLDDYPNVKRWFEAIQARPAVQRAYEIAKRVNRAPVVTEESRSILFGQDRQTPG
jgi:GST-like protein